LVEACLRASVHYLDITGEIAVIEAIAARDVEAGRLDRTPLLVPVPPATFGRRRATTPGGSRAPGFRPRRRTS
jgi:hypothetical protein